MANRQSAKVTKYRRPINLNIGLIIFAIIFIYMIASVVIYLRSEQVTPYEVKIGSLAVNNTYMAVALREETVVQADTSGYVNYYARENEKVATGSMIYTIDATGKLADMLVGADSEESSLTDEDLSELKTSIADFSTSFKETDYSDTYRFKYDIEGTVLKLANYKVLSSLDTLNQANLSDSVQFGYAPESGVLVYSTDGYEGLGIDDLNEELMNPENYTKHQFHSNDLIGEGDNTYKLITGENWSLVTIIDEERAASLAEESFVKVKFLKNGYESFGAVSIIRQDAVIYLKLDFTNSMITYATDRMLEIELITDEDEGLKIPNSAIVEREFYLIPKDYLTRGGNSGNEGFIRETYLEDGTASTEFVEATLYNATEDEYYVDTSIFEIGDYIVKPESTDKYAISKKATLIGVYNINKGYADFKQITILNQNEEYAIIKSNTQYGLSVYDLIALDGNSVDEDDFIY
ncbi:MAG TPA: HlyD family efflux transporter periplasmic adaptor subunit [Lachnospiraceae bacterium]|nr:HlyD family efflux transporter periplasmic adaptor subunit [Lachnospiraceae bacterium]